MVDVFDKAKRSQIMASITAKDTQPELRVRKALHRIGFRYRLHDKTLPGTPDMVFRKYKAVIMVNGCFWHGHNCALFRMPATNLEFWQKKIEKNRERDRKVVALLKDSGWRVLTIWECSIKGRQKAQFDELIIHAGKWLQGDEDELELSGEYFSAKNQDSVL